MRWVFRESNSRTSYVYHSGNWLYDHKAESLKFCSHLLRLSHMYLLRSMSQPVSRKLLINRCPKSAMEDEHILITCLYSSVYFKYMVRITKWANLRHRTLPDCCGLVGITRVWSSEADQTIRWHFDGFGRTDVCDDKWYQAPHTAPTSPLLVFYEGIKTHARKRRPKKISSLGYLTPRNSHQISPYGHETRIDSNQYLSTSPASRLIA